MLQFLKSDKFLDPVIDLEQSRLQSVTFNAERFRNYGQYFWIGNTVNSLEKYQLLLLRSSLVFTDKLKSAITVLNDN